MKPIMAVFGLLMCFMFSSSLLYLSSKLLIPAGSKHKLSFPDSLESLKNLAEFLKDYKENHKSSVLLLFCIAYLYKQTFAIPGSVFLNVLAGALFGLFEGIFLTCILTSCGATFCFLLSKVFAKSILVYYLPEKLKVMESKIHNNEDGLFFFLLCLRLFPMSPNWFLNMSSPIFGIPITYFTPSVFLGLMPYNIICCQTGCILSQITSFNDIFTLAIMLKMTFVAVMVALPGIVVNQWKANTKKKTS